jgi:hypothetical protein
LNKRLIKCKEWFGKAQIHPLFRDIPVVETHNVCLNVVQFQVVVTFPSQVDSPLMDSPMNPPCTLSVDSGKKSSKLLKVLLDWAKTYLGGGLALAKQ